MGYIQSNSGLVTSGTTCSVAFTANVTAGNNLYICIGAWVEFNLGMTASCSDTQGNVYSQIYYFPNVVATNFFLFQATAKTTGPCTVTLTFACNGGSTLGALQMAILEWTTNLTLAPQGGPASGNPLVLNSVTTLGGGLLIAMVYNQTTSGTFTMTPPDFTQRQQISNPGDSTFWVADLLVSSAGTYGGETMTDGAGHLGGVIVTIPQPPSITCASPPQGEIGLAYTHTFPASGGTTPYTFTIATGSLPTGLSMDSSGNVTGTPAVASTFPFTVQVTDSASTVAAVACSITIMQGIPPLAAGCATAIGNISTPYSATLPASGGVPPYSYTIMSGSLPSGLTLDPATGIISGTPDTLETSTYVWRLADSALKFVDTGCSIQILCAPGYQQAKFQLWSVSFKTQPADRADVVHSTDWDDLGHPYDKKLQSITFEYNGEAGDITMQMETLLGINGVTNGTPLLFPLIGNNRSKQQFGIPDDNIVKMIRISPTTIPSVNWRDWKYFVEKVNYPPDFVLFTEKRTFEYECEKIARTLCLDIDTGGIPCAIDVVADGVVKQTISVTTTVNDRSRIIALNSNLIGREFWLELLPGASGKTQLFNWNLQVTREPCAIAFYDSYESDFGVSGIWKWIKQGWVEYQSTDTIIFTVLVDGGNQFFTITLPAHPVVRDVERWYFPAIDPSRQFLNKSRKYRIQITATTGTFKMYSDSILEFTTIGDGQRLKKYNLSERNQLPVG